MPNPVGILTPHLDVLPVPTPMLLCLLRTSPEMCPAQDIDIALCLLPLFSGGPPQLSSVCLFHQGYAPASSHDEDQHLCPSNIHG